MRSDEWMANRRKDLDALLRRNDWRGNDPFDLVNAPLFRRLPSSAYGLLLAISKGGARLPFRWLRPLLRVPPCNDPKILVLSYFSYVLDADTPAADQDADRMLDRLAELAGRNDDGSWWGYDFVWPTLSDGVNPRRASTIVPGAFAVMALAWDVVVRGRNRHRDLLLRAARYYAGRHWKDSPYGARVGYFATSGHNTHNASLLGALALTLGGTIGKNDSWLRYAARATATSLAAVEENGYIPYNDHRSGAWTDCFHHLYVIASLSAIACLNPYVDRPEIEETTRRMDAWYRRTFVREGGVVNYYPGSPWPIDPHNYAAAAIYEAVLGGEEGGGRARAMLDRIDDICWDDGAGYYHHRVMKRWRDRRLFIRWGQAWTLAALSSVLFRHRLLKGLAKFRQVYETMESAS